MKSQDVKLGSYGLIPDVPNPSHFVFGKSALPQELLQPDGNWLPYIPVFEKQKRNNIESNACVIFSLLNCAEILIKRKYGEERNYSEAYLAAVLDTFNQGGTTPVKAGDAIRHHGTPKDEEWPFENIFTETNAEIEALARKFLEEWKFQYEFVPINYSDIKDALKYSPLLFSWTAWFRREDGKFFKLPNMQDNHAITLVGYEEGFSWSIFDTYEDPYIKTLTWELPLIAMRFHIEKKEPEPIVEHPPPPPPPPPLPKKKGFFEWLKELLKWFIK